VSENVAYDITGYCYYLEDVSMEDCVRLKLSGALSFKSKALHMLRIVSGSGRI